MKNIWSFFLIPFLLFAIPLSGQDLIVGFSLGNGFNKKRFRDLTGADFQIKESTLAWKIYASTAWRFLGAEGGYRDFGTVERTDSLGRGTSKTRGGDILGRGVFNIGFLNVFGKAGVFFGRTKNKLVDGNGNLVADNLSRQTSLIWGFGGGMRLGILYLRIEYENIELNPSNLGMLSVGVMIGISAFDSR